MSDYTAKHVGPAFDPRKIGTNARLAPLVTAIKTCPDCGRPTLITHTTDPRPPYDRVGCFWAGCPSQKANGAENGPAQKDNP